MNHIVLRDYFIFQWPTIVGQNDSKLKMNQLKLRQVYLQTTAVASLEHR